MIRQIQTELPVWLVLIGLMLAIFLSWMSYSGKQNAVVFNKPVRFLLMTIRTLAIFLITLLIIGFFFRTEQRQQKQPLYVLAIDNSSSMHGRGADSISTDSLSSDILQIKRSLAEHFDVASLYFGETVRTEDTLNLSDHVTSFSELSRTVRSHYNTAGIAGMLMITDGIATSGASVRDALNDFSFPVTFYAVGDTAQGRDVRINDIQSPGTVLKNNLFDAEILISRLHYPGGEVKISIRDENRRLVRDSLLAFSASESRKLINLSLAADSVGIHVWSVEVEPVEGESNVHNNQQNMVVRVIEESTRIIMLYDQPHPDIRIYHETLKNLEDVDVVLWPLSQGLPKAQDYDLAVFYQLPALAKNYGELQNWLTDSKINAWYIMGPQSDLEQLNDWQEIVHWESGQLGMEDYEATLAPAFSLFSLPDGLDEFLGLMPPLKAPLMGIQPRASSFMLFKQKIKGIELDEPLFWFMASEQHKAAFWLGEGIWRWYNYEYLNNRDHFFTEYLIKSTVNYLLIKDLDERLIVDAPELISSWENFRINARVLNESYQPVTNPEVTLLLTDPEGESRSFKFRKLNEGYWLELDRLAAGRYQYGVETRETDTEMKYEGVLEVLDIPFELLDTRARFEEMEQIASQKGGHFFTFGQEYDLSKYLQSLDAQPVEIIQAGRWVNVLSWFVLLLLISGLFILEWSIRRYLGTR